MLQVFNLSINQNDMTLLTCTNKREKNDLKLRSITVESELSTPYRLLAVLRYFDIRSS